MISANDLRNVSISKSENGYSVEEVNATLVAAADTIDAYVNENKELYRKLEILATKIEEYREEEDSIKSALITAQKMADKIKKDSSEQADSLLSQSNATAAKTVSDAQEKADKLVSEARDYAASIVKEKTDEANALTADAEKKANDAINSSKIVAQNILDQAKEISDDLIAKSKEEKEAYEKLTASLKENAQEFIANVSALYIRQLETLKSAKLDTEKNDESEVNSIHEEVDSLVNEMDEMENAIPSAVTIDAPEAVMPAEEEKEEEPETVQETIETVKADASNDIIVEDEDEFEEIIEEITEPEEEQEPADPMAAVEAFSQNTITPPTADIDIAIPEITEEPIMESNGEKSLFDDDGEAPFDKYFHINKEDVHGDKNQTISLVPPEDDEDGEQAFKGFFGKKKK